MRVISTLSGLFFSSMVSATTLTDVVVFGDSLSDTGNMHQFCLNHNPPIVPAIPSDPYYNGRFSDGPIWIEYLMQSYFNENASNHILNYAFGGAGVTDDPDVPSSYSKQVDAYLGAHDDKADPNQLYVNWIGSNNYLGDPADAINAVPDVISKMQIQLERLIDHGAKHLLVVNVPDLSITPMVSPDPEGGELMKQCSDKHNQELKAMHQHLEKTYPDVDIIYMDVNGTFRDIFKNPTAYDFNDITQSCFEAREREQDASASSVLGLTDSSLKMLSASGLPPTLSDKPYCEGYLFVDYIHPSTKAHQIMAEKVREKLTESHIEFNG